MSVGEELKFLKAADSVSLIDWKAAVLEGSVFDDLLALKKRHTISEAREALKKSQFLVRPRAEVQRWRHIADAMVTCAEISEIDRSSNDFLARLVGLLHQLDPHVDLTNIASSSVAPETGRRQDLLPDYRLVRQALERMTWQKSLSASWAWDLVCRFRGTPRLVAHTVTTMVLLVVQTSIGDRGIAARLILDWLPEDGSGQFYPDPAFSSFLDREQDFLDAERDAVAYVRREGLWPECSNVDVRWRLTRLDGDLLSKVHGRSAGGAYALALACLAEKARAWSP